MNRNLGQQFQQLTMFEPAGKLREGGVGKFLPADLGEVEEYDDEGEYPTGMRTETVEEGWEQKAEEAGEMGLTEHVAEHGVHRPVDLYTGNVHEKGTILNGHHRVAAAAEVSPHMEVPVNWTDRQVPGSEGRKLFPGDISRPKVGPKWSREHEADIGYERFG